MPRLQRQESAVVLTKSLLRAANVPIIGGHHVLALQVRREDNKQHRYWNVVQNTRVAGRRVVQRHVLYLGEIKDTQGLAWRRVDRGARGRCHATADAVTVCEKPLRRSAGGRLDLPVKLSQLQLRRPRQWGACWLTLLMWRELQLDPFWPKRWA